MRARESDSLSVRLSPLPTPTILSSVSMVDSHRSEGPSPAPVSTVMDAFENDFLRKIKVAWPKTKGKILNLVSTINYGDANSSSRHRKGKAHVL
jgi:hypothetical protein